MSIHRVLGSRGTVAGSTPAAPPATRTNPSVTPLAQPPAPSAGAGFIASASGGGPVTRPATPLAVRLGAVNLPEPSLHPDELHGDGSPKYQAAVFAGPLWGPEGVQLQDIKQGFLADCYFVAAVGAIWAADPATLQGMVKDLPDGTLEFTFHELGRGTRLKPVTQQVDRELYVGEDGTALYGKTNNAQNTPRTMETFFAFLEKAYAARRGSYGEIADDTAAAAFEMLLGRRSSHTPITRKGEAFIWETISKAVAEKRPICAGTTTSGKQAVLEAAGLYQEHTYSVLGCSQHDGQKWIQLRNPWGKRTREASPADNGVFEVDLATFKRVFASLSFVEK